MADWDPFADPSDSAAPDAVTSSAGAPTGASADAGGGGGVWQEFEQDDIFAALRVPAKEPKQWKAEEFTALVDVLFGIKDDNDQSALKAAMKPIVEAVTDDGSLMGILWRRAAPIMMDLVDQKKEGARRPNLFGLLVDHQMGFLSGPESDLKPSPIVWEFPPADAQPSGIVVFLYGWGGASLDDLADIAELYRELFPGAVTVRLQCSKKASFGMRVQCGYAIKTALEAWSKAPAGATPKLLVHLFSNAGFMTHTEMLQSWKALSDKPEPDPLLGQVLPPMEQVLRGVVYDSAPDCNLGIGPCLQSAVQSFAAFMHSVVASDNDGTEKGKKDAEWEARKAVQVLIGNSSPFRAHLTTKPERTLIKDACDDGNMIDRLEPAVNMLFIYSLDDTIIHAEGVEKWIARVQARDRMKKMALPRRVCFEKSKHCFHKSIHKDEYFRNIRQFATGVLGS